MKIKNGAAKLKNIWAKLMLISGTFLIFAASGAAQPSEKRVIAFARKISAATLDRKLPKQTIEAWLRSIVGEKSVVSWQRHDCGDQTGEAGDGSSINPRLCAELNARLADNRLIGIQIEIGTFKTGIRGKPALVYIYLEDAEKSTSPTTLRELAELLSSQSRR